jgi:hypothetical protein
LSHNTCHAALNHQRMAEHGSSSTITSTSSQESKDSSSSRPSNASYASSVRYSIVSVPTRLLMIVVLAASQSESYSSSSHSRARETALLDQLRDAQMLISSLRGQNQDVCTCLDSVTTIASLCACMQLTGRLEMAEARCDSLEHAAKQTQLAMTMMSRSASRSGERVLHVVAVPNLTHR